MDCGWVMRVVYIYTTLITQYIAFLSSHRGDHIKAKDDIFRSCSHIIIKATVVSG